MIQIRIEQEAAAVAALPDYEDDEPDTTTSNPHAVRRRMEQEQERKAAKTMAEFEKNAAVEREKDLALQREIARLHRKHQLWMATWGSPGWRMPDKFVRARTSRRRW